MRGMPGIPGPMNAIDAQPPNGTNIEPFRSPATASLDAIEQELKVVLANEPPEKPEAVTGRMQDVAEESAKQVEEACATVHRVAEAVVAEGRELAEQIRVGAAAYEARVAAFAEFAKGVTLNVREAASSASTFTPVAP